MILPKLLIHFADFPYRPCPACRAAHPRALMRFGTTGARPFHRTAHVARCVTLPTSAPGSCPRCSAVVAARVATRRAVPRVSARTPFARRRITSFRGRTRLCMLTDVLLLPRSAPRAPPAVLAHALRRHARARLPRIAPGASRRRSAPSIFGAPRFGRYVATRFLADADLHGHRPTVPIAPAPSLPVLRLAAYPPRRFIPPCSPCLPRAAHWRAPDTRGAQRRPAATFGVCWLRRHPLYRSLLRARRCPARHFGGNQLPDSSFGLSPLCPRPAIELNIRTAQALRQGFPWLRPAQA